MQEGLERGDSGAPHVPKYLGKAPGEVLYKVQSTGGGPLSSSSRPSNRDNDTGVAQTSSMGFQNFPMAQAVHVIMLSGSDPGSEVEP